jgi:phosphoserine phosphatase
LQASPHLGVVGTALLQRANELRGLASSAYFFVEDLPRVIVAGWHLLRYAEAVADELLIEAISARAISGHIQQNDTLLNFVSEYRQTREL